MKNDESYGNSDELSFHDIFETVLPFFDGNREKTIRWFTTENIQLGNQIPVEMHMEGRGDKLMKFIENMLSENEL
jgi:hypothetical protein